MINTSAPAETSTPLLAGFAEWAEPWQRLGLWLSLWNAHADLVEHAAPPGSFWTMLADHSDRFRRRLGQLAGQCRPRGPVVTGPDGLDGMLVAAVPLKQRGRVAGCLVACGLSDAFFDEETFARFCDAHRVDRPLLSRAAADVPRHSPTQLRTCADILIHHLGAFHDARLARQEIEDLSSHLARTYEELHLLYRVSAGMSVHRRPALHLQQLCEELLTTTVVEGFAILLEPPRYLTEPPTVLCVGSVPASPDNLIRLYELVRDRAPNAGPAVVIDRVSEDPHLAWAASWLRRLAFYPLAAQDQRFGALLAINHTDDSPFDSYETNLITTLAERSAALLENGQLYDDLEQLFSGLLHALVSSIDAKDPYTCGHSRRVAWVSRYIAQLAGLSEPRCQRVYLAGLLHDIGKIGIPESVLCKTGRLTPEEFEEMKRHPQIGARILSGVPQVADTIPGILHHHERMDGKGYPAGLAGDGIPLLGRIICLADSYDAMTTHRTYRAARPLQMAIAEIRRCAGTQFDPELADRFLRQDMKALHAELEALRRQSITPETPAPLAPADP